jgi:16S rRNA A1518/A1519 N6-dimethyltransferase RsmA/KsgA/DIM1 with predicted DNA glycosylase/AP lyase activity
MENQNIKETNRIERDQHFLINIKIIKKMIHGLDIKEEDKVIEIGAGQGNITHELVKAKVPILAFEIDSQFQPFLEEIKKDNENLSIIIGNALESSWKEHNKIIGNVPFSAAEAIIQRSIEDRVSLLSILVSSNLKNTLSSNSKLGLIANLFFKVKLIQEVEPESLSPKPKVDCWLIKLERREPLNKTEKIIREILTKNGKTKNAILYSLMKEDLTKTQAKEAITKMNFNSDVLNKPVRRASSQFIIRLRDELRKI